MSRTSALLRRTWPWVVIPLAALLVYYPALRGGLIMDDAEHITPRLLQSSRGLARIWFELGATPHYYPVLNSVFWCEHLLWGDVALGYHLANLVQHAAVACLVVLVARRLNLPGAVFAGLVFAVHPVHVESVAWISEQKNTLSTLLGLGAVLAYFSYQEKRRPVVYALASALFLAALLTKTVVAVIPPALLVVTWWRQGRLAWKRDIAPLLPWLLTGMILGLFSAWFERTYSHAEGAAFHVSLLERTLIAGRGVCFYVRTLVWPANLVYINPRWTPDVNDPAAYAGLGCVLLVGATLVALARRWRGPLVAFLLFTGMLFPVLGFLNINWFNFSYVANHFAYLPSLGLVVPLAAVVASGIRRLTPHAGAAWAASGLAVATLLAVARQHAADFRSPETLYRRTLEKNPACWLARNNLGVLQLDDPTRLTEAIGHFERALQLKPDHARAHNNYGTALLRANRPMDAIEQFRRSLELQNGVAEVHLNLGQALLAVGAPASQVLDEITEAIRLKPDYVDAHVAKATALARQPGYSAETIAACREVLAFAPERAELHQALAVALLGSSAQRAESLRHFREAIRLKPDFAEAYNNLGTALAADDTTLPAAIEALTRATQLAPGYADAHYNLGLLLARAPAGRREGLVHLREAVRLAPADFEMRNSLAAVLAQAPADFAEAAAELRAVVASQPTRAQAHVNLASVLVRIPGGVEEAREHFRRALALEPDNRAAAAGLSALERRER
jgi:tetratricopeptide (TPR) repeat protein